MHTQTEMWSESRMPNHNEVMGSMIRWELEREKVLRLDMSYLGDRINQWWLGRKADEITPATIATLRVLIGDSLKKEHLECLRNVGDAKASISAVLLTHMFSFPSKQLALLVHEAISETVGIADIKYPYEDHKELFPKNSEQLASDWGRGLGVIRPHSDDLYEEQAINAMCLTVCKDTSSTPTWLWMLKDIVACLSDEELGYLAFSEATFLSGTNVEGKTIEVHRPVVRRDQNEGVGLRLDFRVDDKVGPRMRFADNRAEDILNKMRSSLKYLKPLCTHPATGSVSILANYKVLHGRSSLSPVMLYEGESSRILFRSKGTK